MVDLFGRAGLLDRAIDFVKRMPMEADAVIWAALLGACRIYKNLFCLNPKTLQTMSCYQIFMEILVDGKMLHG